MKFNVYPNFSPVQTENIENTDFGKEPLFKPYEPKVRVVLLAQVGLFILGAGASGIVYQALCLMMGWEPNIGLNVDSPISDRWQLRFQLGLGHLLAFCASGAMVVWLFYRSLTGIRPGWPDYLGCRKIPSVTTTGLALLLMLVSIPLVLYSMNLNQKLPLPEIFKMMEDQTEETLKGLLKMESMGEFLVNLTIIALLPAIGEELVFRGVVQQQLMRRIANPMLAIILSAMVFSFAHFQFEGFLPRMLLGIILGWLYWHTRNFWVPVIAHFFNNGIQVAGQYLYGKEMSSIDLEKDIEVPWEFALISLFMIVAVYRLIRGQTKRME
jgi:membrane protease YdiL (CAAX protease family)